MRRSSPSVIGAVSDAWATQPVSRTYSAVPCSDTAVTNRSGTGRGSVDLAFLAIALIGPANRASLVAAARSLITAQRGALAENDRQFPQGPDAGEPIAGCGRL